MDTYKVKLTFTEPLLGAVAMNKELYGDYIGGKAPNGAAAEEEFDSVLEMEKGTTGFHRNSAGQPMLYDYVLKGFFKDACGMLRRDSDTGSSKLAAFKKVIDGLVFVSPRRIPITLSGDITFNERPLRAQTAQGERVALARSESAPEGSTIEFTVEILGGVKASLLKEWFDYGKRRGLGQWRNASYGRFTYQIERLTT